MTDPLTQTTLRTLASDPPQVGERMLLFLHRHLRAARAAGLPPADVDILMFRPPSPDGQTPEGRPDHGEWTPVPAAKYLKRRAEEWREAERVEDLPIEYQERAAVFEEWLAGVGDGLGIGSNLGGDADLGVSADLRFGADLEGGA